jgi:hypothetical protein
MFDNPSLISLSVCLFLFIKREKTTFSTSQLLSLSLSFSVSFMVEKKKKDRSYKVKEDPVGTMKYRLGKSERVFLFEIFTFHALTMKKILALLY